MQYTPGTDASEMPRSSTFEEDGTWAKGFQYCTFSFNVLVDGCSYCVLRKVTTALSGAPWLSSVMHNSPRPSVVRRASLSNVSSRVAVDCDEWRFEYSVFMTHFVCVQIVFQLRFCIIERLSQEMKQYRLFILQSSLRVSESIQRYWRSLLSVPELWILGRVLKTAVTVWSWKC